MFNFIKDFIEAFKAMKRRKIACKRFVIHQQVTKFYQDLQDSTGNTDIPPFVYADQAMKTFVKTDKDVNRFYKNLVKSGMA